MANVTGPDWFLREWADYYGLTQADMGKELDLHKNTTNRLWHGDQPYRRDYVNDVAAWLKIEVFELFMHPDDAMEIRRFRQAALHLASERKRPQPAPEAVKPAKSRKAN